MTHDRQKSKIREYYAEAGEDYKAWSPDYNMHFGYYRWGLNPLSLESMLREMSDQVIRRLAPRPEETILDMGCGLAATARRLATTHPEVHVHGGTIVPWQVEKARHLVQAQGLENRVRISLIDYRDTPFLGATQDGAYAVESSCHDEGLEKAGFIQEMARILKPGARLVVADGFTKNTQRPMNRVLRYLLHEVCRNWAVPCFADIDAFTKTLKAHGFNVDAVEEISYALAPSVLHIPAVTLRFLFREFRKNGLKLNRVRWGHVWASVLSPFVGIARRRFGYYLIQATRRGA